MKLETRNIIQKNCQFTHSSNVEGVLTTIHPNSELYSHTKNELESLFDAYQLGVSLTGFRYMGKDKNYAYVRAQQKTERVAGPEFKDSIIDQMIVFKQDGDDWKIWTTAILNIKYID